jgi:D-methionine transport system permease protein
MDKQWELFQKIVFPSVGETLFMLFSATVISLLIGFGIAVFLFITNRGGLKEQRFVYQLINTIVNIVNSFPFIILVVALIPVTRAVVGTPIGNLAAIFPLSIAGSAAAARLIEGNLNEVDKSLVEAAQSYGASVWQIVFKVVLRDSKPMMIYGATILIINILGMTAMAGTIGGGGLGAVAITYGYQGFNRFIMYGTVIVLILLVELIQVSGIKIYNWMRNR